MRQRKLWAMAILAAMLASVGCAKKVSVHPGAISNLDSYAYDVLLTEQDVLNAAKADVVNGTMPAGARPEVNAAIVQYNATQALWQTYHANGAGADALTQALTALVGLLGQIQQMRGRSVAPAPTSGLRWPMRVEPILGGAM